MERNVRYKENGEGGDMNKRRNRKHELVREEDKHCEYERKGKKAKL